MEDRELLQQFVREHSQAAFRELVARHTDWVYSTCLRRLRDPGAAEDATQAVFLALAQKAPGLLKVNTLSSWLHQAAKYVSNNILRARQRRARHEMEAAAVIQAQAPAVSPWQEIESELEPALDRLGSRDRQAILMRFYEQKSHAQIASVLQISEPAAQKRLSRALDRLRSVLLSTGGFTLSASAITNMLGANAVATAPASVAASVAGVTASTVPAQVAPLTKGILYTMTMAKLKTAVVAAAVMLIAVPPSVVVVKSLAAAPDSAPLMAQTIHASTPVATPTSPLDAIKLTNQAVDQGDPAAYANSHAHGTPDEDAHSAAMQALVANKRALLDAYRAKIDPDGKSPLPPSMLVGAFLNEANTKAITIKMIDDNTAEVKVPGVLKYRVIRSAPDAPWLIHTEASLASMYPSDPGKAVSLYAKRFSAMASAYEETTNEIKSGVLATPQAVTAALSARLAATAKTLEGMPPAVIDLPLHVANQNFLPPPASKDYRVDFDSDVRRTADSAPAGRIQSIGSKAKNDTRAYGYRTCVLSKNDLSAFLGKRIRVSAWIKTTDAANWGGIGLWAVGANSKVFVMADNSDFPVHGTTDWKQISLVADIPNEVTALGFNYFLRGTGTLWADDFQVDVVSQDVPVNDDQGWQKWSFISPQYDFALDPNVQHDGHPAMCISSTSAPSSAWCSYGQNDRYPQKYLGKKARMTAWIKTENLTGKSGIWLRTIVGNNTQQLELKENRPLSGTHDWTQISAVINVPPETQCLSSSVVMFGKGKLWVDLQSVKYEVVDEDASEHL